MRCSGLVQDTVIEEPLVRSPGRIVALAHAGSIPLLAGKLAYGSQKVELQADERVQAPGAGEGGPGAGAVVPNAAAHGQPVSLFDVGLVVLLVAAASRKAHSSPLAPVVKRVVDELTSVVLCAARGGALADAALLLLLLPPHGSSPCPRWVGLPSSPSLRPPQSASSGKTHPGSHRSATPGPPVRNPAGRPSIRSKPA